MPIRSLSILRNLLPGKHRAAAAEQQQPACIVLEADPGQTPSNLPPVRMFIGTEARQFRAERVLLWSIQRHRNPARRYEIYLMKDLAGFRRHFWLTGFTNYRFAIPELAGFSGRAIYNDADQIYLQDPAKLFDTEMDQHGFLSINDADTSVMLIDCERMAPYWNRATAQQQHRRTLEARARAAGCWGQLAPGWNARDTEYDPDSSGVVHFTTIHTQPWRPFPREYVYGPNPVGHLWHALEREADHAGYQVFTARAPGPDFARQLAAWREQDAATSGRLPEPLTALLQTGRVKSMRYCGLAADTRELTQITPGGSLERIDPETLQRQPPQPADAVIGDQLLEFMPDGDIPWLLEALFQHSRRIVSICIERSRLRGHRHDALWWYQQLAAAATRHPDRHWQLIVHDKGRVCAQWQGGAPLAEPPVVWVLENHKLGHRHQARDLARALGWPYQTIALRANPVGYVLASLTDHLFGQPQGSPTDLAPPWPDLVIGSGWLGAFLARRIGRRSGGRTRLVLTGRKAGPAEESADLVVSCMHFDLPFHPQRIETLLPPNRGSTEAMPVSTTPGAGKRQLAVLVGGDSKSHCFDTATAAAMGREVRRLIEGKDVAVTVVTSRRTGAAAESALVTALGEGIVLHSWRRQPDSAPYQQQLRAADAFVVTGESESMLADVTTTGKPVYFYPLPDRRARLITRFSAWVVRQAATPRYNRRGTKRPQEGLRYFCSRLLERGLILPPRQLQRLHEALLEHGLARPLDASARLDFAPGPVVDHGAEVARRVREKLGWNMHAGSTPTADASRQAKVDAVVAADPVL